MATPLLRANGLNVLGVVRRPEHEADVRADGAQPICIDATALNDAELQELMAPADVIVWSAGAAGQGGPEATRAIDQDLAIRVVRAAASGAKRLIMVSFVRMPVPADHPLRVYSQAKRAADAEIRNLGYHEGLRYVILGPTVLTDDPATGISLIAEGDMAAASTPVSRELVAQVIAHFADVDTLPCATIDFSDGDQLLGDILPS